jgi:hypothetical protein
MGNLRKQAGQAGAATRVSGVTTEQTIRTGAGVLERIVVANGNAAAQTLTIADGATVRHVARVPAGTTLALEYLMGFGTSLKVTPSAVEVDALILFS